MLHRSLIQFTAMAGIAILMASQAGAAEPYTILNVDGDKISSQQVTSAWNSLFPEGVAPEFESFDEDVRQNVLRGLVSESLLYKQAEKAGIAKRAAIQQRLKNLEKQIVIQAYIEELSDSFVNEKSIKKAYEKYVAKSKKEDEIRARHILVDSQKKAKEIVAQLNAGKDFSKLAKQLSSDKGSAAKGGDLDYFTRDKMVPEFADAAFKLQPGEVSPPVKSDFGWHVIKVEDRRPVKVKPLEEIQEQLKAQVRKEGIEHYVDQLISKAEVKYYTPEGNPKKLNLKN